MILSGGLFIWAVLLMTPKGGIGFGLWGMSTSNEYGSKKSVEFTLKRVAIVSLVIFTCSALIYPYLAKKSLSTGKISAGVVQSNQKIKLAPENIKIKTENNRAVEIKTKSLENK